MARCSILAQSEIAALHERLRLYNHLASRAVTDWQRRRYQRQMQRTARRIDRQRRVYGEQLPLFSDLPRKGKSGV